jgi:hypothetical protein
MASPPQLGKDRDASDVDRAIDDLSQAIGRLGEGESFTDVDLVVGTNRLNHGLGRRPVALEVMPAAANASFAWGYDPEQADNPHPDRQAWITVTGTAMAARVFFR